MRRVSWFPMLGLGSTVFLCGCGALGGLLPSDVELPAELAAARAADNLVDGGAAPAASERKPVQTAAELDGCWASRVPDENVPVPGFGGQMLRTGGVNVMVFDFDRQRLSQQSLIRTGGGFFEFVYVQEGSIEPPMNGQVAGTVDTLRSTDLSGALQAETFDPIPMLQRAELSNDGLLILTLLDPNDPADASEPTVFERIDCPDQVERVGI